MAFVSWRDQKVRITQEYASAVRSGDQPDVELFLQRVDQKHRDELFKSLILTEIAALRDVGEDPQLSDYRSRFRTYSVPSSWFELPTETKLSFENTSNQDSDSTRVKEIPDQIETYRVDKLIGQGGFGPGEAWQAILVSVWRGSPGCG